jgi:hypothetical protein
MINNIIFSGCSFTWGQSLHYYGDFNDDEHPRDGFYYERQIMPHHYQYNVDNRFSTIISDYFVRKPIVSARNGNSNCRIIELVYNMVNKYTDCVIIQTTSFSRCFQERSEDGQLEDFETLIDYLESKNILVRFIHYDFEEKFITPKILERTIPLFGYLSFYDEVTKDDSKYTIYSDFKDDVNMKTRDTHFNLSAHRLVADTIIDNLKNKLYIPSYKLI